MKVIAEGSDPEVGLGQKSSWLKSLRGRPKTTDETCLYLDLQRSKVLVELALQPESRPKAQKPPKVRYARTRRGTEANGFRLRGQHFAVRSGVMQSAVLGQPISQIAPSRTSTGNVFSDRAPVVALTAPASGLKAPWGPRTISPVATS